MCHSDVENNGCCYVFHLPREHQGPSGSAALLLEARFVMTKLPALASGLLLLRSGALTSFGLLIATGVWPTIASAQSAPRICAAPEVHASDAEGSDRFGQSVSLDGDTFVVGAPADNGAEPGTAYVFRNVAGSPVEEARLTPSDGIVGQGFAGSVAIEGDLLVVGAQYTTNAGVYTFTRSGALWTEQQKLSSPDGAQAVQFGTAVALFGNTLAVGDPGYRDTSGVLRGVVYVYSRPAASWILQQRIQGAGSRYFGWSLALQADTLIVGAIAASGPFPISGVASVYRRNLIGTWNIEGTLSPTILARDFGWDVALDGDSAVVADQSPSAQSAWVFSRTGGAWSQEARLIGSQPFGPGFAESVELKGARLVVGDGHAQASGPHWGLVWIFDRSGAGWSETARLEPSETGDIAGFGEGLAFDGLHLIIGADGDDDFGPDSGSAWPYLVSDGPATYCTAKVNSLGCTPAISYTGLPSLSGADDFYITASHVLNNKPGTLLLSPTSAAMPFLGGILCVQAPIARTPNQVAHGTPPPLNCTGSYSFFLSHAYMGAHAFQPGTQWYAQYWSRDPGFAPPNNIGLSDGIGFLICW